MKKKLNKTILFVLIIAIILFGIAETCFNYIQHRNYITSNLKNTAQLILISDYDIEEIGDVLSQIEGENIRFSCIDTDGKVILDNQIDVSLLDNHSSRAEFKEVIKNGKSNLIRYSKSLSKEMCYYAVLKDDLIYRFGIETSSMWSIMTQSMLFIIAVGIIILLISIRFTIFLSKSFTQPVEKLAYHLEKFSRGELEADEVTVEYEELKPIAQIISNLNRKIDNYRGRLRNESEKTTLVFENMMEGMIILDEKRNIININQSAIEMFSENSNFYILDEMNISELITETELIDAINHQEEKRAVKEFITHNGCKICAYINRVKIAESDSTIVILADVSKRFEAEELRREFSANVSHELKTPLTTIKGFGELFRNGMITEPESIKKYGSRIEIESQRLLFLINDIIRLSELEETSEILTKPINLMQCAKEVIEILDSKATKNNINVSIKGDSSIVCDCNENYIRELYTNLIDNAIKYNRPQGFVEVTISQKNNQHIIKVKDNGIGIPEKDKERIFERFYRVDKSHSRQTGGTGLGLSIVKHIISYHKGSVNLESELGVGTEITVYLPKV